MGISYGMVWGFNTVPRKVMWVGWWCGPVAVGAGKSATFRAFVGKSMYAPKRGPHPERMGLLRVHSGV